MARMAKLILIFPLAIVDRVKDFHDPVWKMILLLRRMHALLFAPTLSRGQLSLLEGATQDYMQKRVECFPDVKRRPKHEYTSHGAELTHLSGPLRYQSSKTGEHKHGCMEKIVKKLGNYKNVTKTIAERHQLMEISNVNEYTSRIEPKEISDYDPNVSDPLLKFAISQFECETGIVVTFFAEEVKYRGIEYAQNDFVCINKNEYGIYEILPQTEVTRLPQISIHPFSSLLSPDPIIGAQIGLKHVFLMKYAPFDPSPSDDSHMEHPADHVFKVVDASRTKRKSVIVKHCDSLLSRTTYASGRKLNVIGASIVLEEDGTEIDEDELLVRYKDEIFMLLTHTETWEPAAKRRANEGIQSQPPRTNTVNQTRAQNADGATNTSSRRTNGARVHDSVRQPIAPPIQNHRYRHASNGRPESITNGSTQRRQGEQRNQGSPSQSGNSEGSSDEDSSENADENVEEESGDDEEDREVVNGGGENNQVENRRRGAQTRRDINVPWAHYKVPYGNFDCKTLTDLQNGVNTRKRWKRLRTKFVHRIVDDLRAINISIPELDFEEIALSMSQKYPKIFTERFNDSEDGEVIGNGVTRLVRKMLNRNYYFNRPEVQGLLSHQLRIPLWGLRSLRAIRSSCPNWQPAHLPANATLASLEESRVFLLNISQYDLNDPQMLAACVAHFKKSFAAQRFFINSVKLRKASELLIAWSCLFQKLFLSHHFQQLTGCTLDTFTTRYSNDEPKILAYGTLKRYIDNADMAHPYSKSIDVVKVVLKHFNECFDDLIRVVPCCFSTLSRVRLFADESGPEYEGPPIARQISILLHGDLFIRSCEDMVDALKCLLTVYFTLNGTYPEGTARTLEFFQRNFLNMVPSAVRCRDKNKIKKVETLIAHINDLRIIPRV
ncbi:hypothetical protein QAD02_013815 [Eretmocerus hayati]|uniref:Uncharacterized protein n=1 Tax=Eretmocerus hayati TaxID=131215 RepID=A0ACC2P4I5_9HYME|nr:hypothetical protein QAD02_013815 [Eretmocerus hayati]